MGPIQTIQDDYTVSRSLIYSLQQCPLHHVRWYIHGSGHLDVTILGRGPRAACHKARSVCRYMWRSWQGPRPLPVWGQMGAWLALVSVTWSQEKESTMALLMHWPPRPSLPVFLSFELRALFPVYHVLSLCGPQSSVPSTVHREVCVDSKVALCLLSLIITDAFVTCLRYVP